MKIVLVEITLGVLLGITIYYALTSTPDGASGWYQVSLAIFGIPIILYQLNEIQQGLNRKPKLEIGLVTANDLPISRIRNQKSIPTTIEINYTKAEFYLIIRNQGERAARYIKLHLEQLSEDRYGKQFKGPQAIEYASPIIGGTILQRENDNEYTLGADLTLYPDDIEVIRIELTTKKIRSAATGTREFPGLGDCVFNCTVWAEGLDAPINKQLTVKITDKLLNTSKLYRPEIYL